MSKDGWNGRFSNLRVSESSFPELHKELSPLNHKDRCDRLRVLAMIGLYSLRGTDTGVAASAVEAQPLGKEPNENEGRKSKVQSVLMNKFLSSV